LVEQTIDATADEVKMTTDGPWRVRFAVSMALILITRARSAAYYLL
jgi:hypothetical protein